MNKLAVTSNLTKLLKHLPNLWNLQEGRVHPVMVHIAPTNICNLECEYCCYGGRPLADQLTKSQVKTVIREFLGLGVHSIEWTGGGEPTLYKDLDECLQFARQFGMHQGLITNAIKFDWVTKFDCLDWMRVSFHGFNEGKERLIEENIKAVRKKFPKLSVSGVYIWTSGSDDVYPKVAKFCNKYGITTRVTPDLTAGCSDINQMMEHVREAVSSNPNKFTFLSDFNVKTERKHDHCYMHMIKPFVFPDGWVYVCPSIGLSPENLKNVDSPFRVCKIEDIAQHYGQPAYMRKHDCKFCKYSVQNEFIDDLLTEVEHDAFC